MPQIYLRQDNKTKSFRRGQLSSFGSSWPSFVSSNVSLDIVTCFWKPPETHESAFSPHRHKVFKTDYEIKCCSREHYCRIYTHICRFCTYNMVIKQNNMCVCAYIIMRALCTCLHSASRSGTLAHSCLCLSGSLSILFLLVGFLKKSQQCFLTISEPENAASSEGWGRRSYQAFPGAVTVTPSPCCAAPTPRTKQPCWWW